MVSEFERKMGQVWGQEYKFFRILVAARRKKNRVNGLFLSNGDWCTEDSVLQNKALNIYKSLVCTNVECSWRCCL